MTGSDLVRELRALGLGEGCALLVHGSFKSLGPVEGGPAAVLGALSSVAATVLLPTLSFAFVDEPDVRFDVLRTPSETGILSELARKRPDAIRSEHPFSSAVAFGDQAGWLTAEHLNTPCGPTSPYWRLASRDRAFSLFIGTDFNRNTLFHVAEEVAGPSYLCYKRFTATITSAAGQEKTADVARYDCYQQGIQRHLIKMRNVYRERGVLGEGRVGQARCFLVPARANVEIAVDLLRREPNFILTPSGGALA